MFHWWLISLFRLHHLCCTTIFITSMLVGQSLLFGNFVPQSDQLSVLRFLEAQIQTNNEQIGTLSGEYQLTDGFATKSVQIQSSQPDGELLFDVKRGNFWEERNVAVKFVLDARNDKLFTTYESTENSHLTDRDTGLLLETREIPVKE